MSAEHRDYKNSFRHRINRWLGVAPPPLAVIDCDADTAMEDLVGLWRRMEGMEPGWKGKEFLPDGSGYLGNFGSGRFERGKQFRWKLQHATIFEYRGNKTFHEKILSREDHRIMLYRCEDGRETTFHRVSNGSNKPVQ